MTTPGFWLWKFEGTQWDLNPSPSKGLQSQKSCNLVFKGHQKWANLVRRGWIYLMFFVIFFILMPVLFSKIIFSCGRLILLILVQFRSGNFSTFLLGRRDMTHFPTQQQENLPNSGFDLWNRCGYASYIKLIAFQIFKVIVKAATISTLIALVTHGVKLKWGPKLKVGAK